MKSAFELTAMHYQTGKAVQLQVVEGKIASLKPAQASPGTTLPWVAPGMVDLQINGYGGIDFNTPPLTEEAVHQVTRRIAALGVTTYYPTVITNSGEQIEQLVATIASACRADSFTDSCIAGIHIEGPFISPVDGARGAHDKAFVCAPDWSWMERWIKAAQGKLSILTLSPEWDNAPAFIRTCVQHGIRVSIGHTVASPEQIQQAVAAGASLSTHLGNGAPGMLPRHSNIIWEQLAHDELSTCAIADGFHLPDSVLKVFLKVRGEQLIIVSDAVYLSGMEAGEYDTHIGGRVVLTPEGRLHTAANPEILAGSAQMLPANIEHIARSGLCSPAQAWDMASLRPAAYMQLPAALGLAEGAPADLVLFDWDQDKLIVHDVYKAGERVASKD